MSCNEWKVYKLKDVCTKIGSGSTPRGGASVYREEGTTLIRSQNVYNNSFDYNGLVFIDDSAADKLSNVELKKNDVLLNITGDSVARCTIVPDKLLPARVNQHVCILRANTEILHPFYLKSFLVNSRMQKIMLSLAQSGGTRAALTKGMIESFDISIPPLNEQNKIVDILSSLDDKIELNHEMNKTLEEMAQSLFKRWFVDFEFPNEKGKPYKSSGGEMVDSELGMIPKGWKVDNLSSLIKIQNGYAFKSKDLKDEGYCRVIKIKNINDLKVDINNTQYIEVDISKKIDKKYHLKSNDIIIAMTGAEVGKIGILPQTENILYLNQRVGKFVENKLGGKYYTLCMLSSTDGQSLLKNKSMGSAQPNISSSAIEEFRIVLPKEDILDQFYKITNPMYEKISRNNGNNITLNILRDTILPKLMSGEISLNE